MTIAQSSDIKWQSTSVFFFWIPLILIIYDNLNLCNICQCFDDFILLLALNTASVTNSKMSPIFLQDISEAKVLTAELFNYRNDS